MNSLDSQLDDFAAETADMPAPAPTPTPAPPPSPSPTSPLPMPAAIAKAIIAVKGKVKSLPKGEENVFGKYKYLGVDAFYASIGPLMAEAGLLLVTDEAEAETVQRASSVWLRLGYELTLYHESGTAYGPVHRTLMLQASGPQAFGAAASYVEKYFLRGLFRVPTGEPDADAEQQEELPAVAALPAKRVGAFNRNQPPPPPAAAPPPVAAAKFVRQKMAAHPAPKRAAAEAPAGLSAQAHAKAEAGWDIFRPWYMTVLSDEQRLELRPQIAELKAVMGVA